MIQDDRLLFREAFAFPIKRNCVVQPLLEAISKPCLHMRSSDLN